MAAALHEAVIETRALKVHVKLHHCGSARLPWPMGTVVDSLGPRERHGTGSQG